MISDPIEFELFKNALFGVADEMALTVFRTTYSGVLKDNMDYSTAMFDGAGVLVAQGLTLPGHLGSMPTAIAAVKAAFAGAVHPGDVYILNDPFQGGMHLPDVFIFKPIFREDELIAWAGRCATTPMSAAGCRGRTRRIRPRSTRRGCASRR
jgi:N-methylhydantoinase B